MMRTRRPLVHLFSLVLALGCLQGAVVSRAFCDEPDTLQFEPVEPSAQDQPDEIRPIEALHPARRRWLNVPFHEYLLEGHHDMPSRRRGQFDAILDYNRVDELRVGLEQQAQGPWTFSPRFAARLEYATGRRRWLYGAQLEQPLEPGNHLAVGVAMLRATDHLDLNQVQDFENSLALLFGRTDSRDYFEREGAEAYLAARWPGVTIASLHVRNDRYRSLAEQNVQSWFHRDRTLRPNPPIAEGEMRAIALRFERHARRSGGVYHWIELESAGNGLGGDFEYRRAVADLRSAIRLTPAMGLHLRALGGSTMSGELPPQREFTIGGVDGLRARSFDAFRGDQVALGQLEYVVGFGRMRRGDFDGLHVIAFADAGNAWRNPDHHWDVERQRFDLDGGFGLGTAEDNLRVYFAKDLREPDSGFVISARLQRPF
jgi:surface antigen Omp85-like protein